jgi:chromosomal replication initiator protein
VNLATIWNATLGCMQLQTSRQEFNTWLRGATLHSIDNGVATIGVASTFLKEGLENRYTGPLRDVISELVGQAVHVRVVIAPGQPPRADTRASGREFGQQDELSMDALDDSSARGQPLSAPFVRSVGQTKGHTHTTGKASSYTNGSSARQSTLDRRMVQQLELTGAVRSGMLNSRYSFDRFIVGSSNRLAHAACVAVAEHPARAYNPLFLYGGVGLGKTHLLHAIGNYALDHDPEISVMYVSSEKFTNDLINAIRRQQTEEFRIRYRNIDILLIDDIQFIAGKESTQEEFFHTFNTLHSAGKQIIISSDRPPKAILTLEERLRSRFEWGLIVDVQLPDLETRTAILRAKAEQMAVLVPEEVIDFLAHRIQSNIRELEGCLNRVVAYADMTNAPVSVEIAAAALAELLDTTRRKRTAPEAIINAVAEYYGVEVGAIIGRGRSRNIVVPRQVAMYLLRDETDCSLVDIGTLLGGRDHTTVIYGCEKIGEDLSTDTRLRQDIMLIRERLYQHGAHE